MTGGICFEFDISHHTTIVLLVLGATIVVLLIAQVPLLQVSWQSSKIVLPSCSLRFADLSQYLYSKGGCTRISTWRELPAVMVKHGPR